MDLRWIYGTAWIFCILAIVCATPLSNVNGQVQYSSGSSGAGESTFVSEMKPRTKRQLNAYVWDGGFFQNIGKAVTDTVSRLRGIVPNGTSSDSLFQKMVNDFRTRLAPVLLSRIYVGALQNIWDQFAKQARSTFLDILNQIGGT